ncbi:hypothetical protein DV515_00000283, partial [Chloebia gouldiae]
AIQLPHKIVSFFNGGKIRHNMIPGLNKTPDQGDQTNTDFLAICTVLCTGLSLFRMMKVVSKVVDM